MTEQLKQAIIESGKQYFRSIIIRGVWRVEQKVIGNALRSLFSFLLLSDAEVLEDIVQRFLAADLAAGDFAQLLQYHFQILGDDVAAHTHFHRLQYTGEGSLGTEKSLVVAGTRNDDVVLGNLRYISGFYQCLLQG